MTYDTDPYGGIGMNIGRQGNAIPAMGMDIGQQGKAIPARGMIQGIRGTFAGMYVELLHDTPIYIGRDSSQCTILLEGDFVSRVHACVIYNAVRGCYYVRDFSTNGIIADKKYRLKKGVDVEAPPGTELWIGNGNNVLLLGGR